MICDKHATWVHFKSTAGKLYSYCTVTLPVKTRKSQKLAVLLCSLRRGCPSHQTLTKVTRTMRRTFGKSPDCQHTAKSGRHLTSQRTIWFNGTEEIFCVENSYLLQIWPSILCVHGPVRNCV